MFLLILFVSIRHLVEIPFIGFLACGRWHRFISHKERLSGRLFFLSHLVAELAGTAARLDFKFRREVIGRLEIQSVGYFLDADVGGGKQFLGPLQPQVLLVESRRNAVLNYTKISEEQKKLREEKKKCSKEKIYEIHQP